MVEELHRQGKSAVLVVFDRPADGNYSLHKTKGVSLHCIGSDDMTGTQLREVIQSIAIIESQQPQLSSDAKHDLYDLKGDQLGMSLAEFKAKYHRVVSGHDQPAPFSSDHRRNLGAITLLSEKWHAEAIIVHCSIEFPFERRNGNWIPTVAEIEMDLLIYKFVDDELFQISGYFDTRNFDLMSYRLQEKYGRPQHESTKPKSALWSNNLSTIRLIRGRISPKEWSILNISRDRLLLKVQTRSPKTSADL